jgi:hypothetical protein
LLSTNLRTDAFTNPEAISKPPPGLFARLVVAPKLLANVVIRNCAGFKPGTPPTVRGAANNPPAQAARTIIDEIFRIPRKYHEHARIVLGGSFVKGCSYAIHQAFCWPKGL